MKKIFNLPLMAFVISAILIFATSCSSDDDNTNTNPEGTLKFSELPDAAQLFVQNHFEEKDVDAVLRNTTEGTEGYNISVSKYKIDFDKNGVWKKIEAKDNGSLPVDIVALIPTPISGYISQNYAGRGINEIKKKDYGYQVELAGKPEVELEFNFNGEILNVDEDDNSETITLASLPEVSQAFVATHYPNASVKEVKKDGSSYEVVFTDNTQIEFSATGEWIKIEADNNIALPQSIINLLPANAVSYITSTYAGKSVKEIEKKTDTYEVELYNNIDITFDADGNVWGVSDNNQNNEGNQNKITFESLPQSVKTFVNTHFPNINVQYVNKTGQEYKIGLIDGTRMDFTFDNEIQTIVSVRGEGIPNGAVLPAIADYISKNYPNKKMTVYIKQFKGYIVELSGYPVSKIFFDLNGNFLRVY